MIEYIKGNDDKLLSIIIRKEFSVEGIKFITEEESSLQVGIMMHKEGYKIKPHQHKEVIRTINCTQEVVHIEHGKVEACIYNECHLISKHLLTDGDTIILLSGGHGFNVLEDTKMMEVKQGPYRNLSEDKKWLGVKSVR